MRKVAKSSEVKPILASYKLVSRSEYPNDTVVRIGNASFGGGAFTVIAGPCAVESFEQLYDTATQIKSFGVSCLRGGAYKPRTSPYSFQGLEEEGLKIMQEVSKSLQIPFVTEVMDTTDVELVERYADAFQVGTRNMQNFKLLKRLGQTRKPVLLKRGMAARVEELLMAAEYVVGGGNLQVILCERGIRTFETATRNTLDLNAIPYLKEKSHLPVIVDPSHGTGVRRYVAPMAMAAAACGADGLLIEVHNNPDVALSDGDQSLWPDQLGALMKQLDGLTALLGKRLSKAF